MEMRLLRSFLVVAEELHFGRAAVRLHITQPPLSKQIAQLEAIVGARLFERDRRSVALSAAGQALVGEAQRLINQYGMAIDMVRQVARGDAGRVRIAFNASVLFMGVDRLVSHLKASLPTVTSSWEEMSTVEQTDALRHDRIDVGFAQAPQTLQGLEHTVIAKVPMVVAVPASHVLATLAAVPLIRLKDEDFALSPREIGPGFFDLVVSACRSAGFSPRIQHHPRHLLTALSLVATGAAVSLVPQSLSRASLPGVVFRPIAAKRIVASYSAIWNPANVLPILPKVLAVFGVRAG